MAIITEIDLTGGPYDSTAIVDTVAGFPVGDKAVSSAFVASMIASLIGDGVVDTGDGALAVVPAGGLSVKVNPGTAWVQGYMARLDGELTLELSSGHEYTVYLRQNYGLGEAVIGVYEDNDGNIPVRFYGVYDIILGKVKIPADALTVNEAMITDTRGDSELCGYVTSKARLA